MSGFKYRCEKIFNVNIYVDYNINVDKEISDISVVR